jgi:metallo-beta-lactamase family protein
MQLEFCGAAQEVTGSCYLLVVGGVQFLVDCGMHQGDERDEARNFEAFAFDPHAIAFVLLTHAHIDHSGLLPRLVAKGFGGPIYATAATADLAEIMLLDSAHIQEMEAEWSQRKERRAGRRAQQALYTSDEARETARLLRAVEYGEVFRPAVGVTARYRDAGHILGSAMIELWVDDGSCGPPASPADASDAVGESPVRPAAATPSAATPLVPTGVKLVFSGDVGQPDQPIIRDPETVTGADYLVLESTYGDRLHEHARPPLDELWEIVQQAKASGGNIVIPSFAVGRTQELIYYFRRLAAERDFDMPVFVDSPLAVRATEVFRRHREDFDAEANGVLEANGSIFTFPGLTYTQSSDESRALNDRRGVVIISSSGMAEAGRIKHHLKHNLWKREAHIVFVGYQARGTLGRQLLDGAKMVRIFGEEIAVKAHIHDVGSLSAHADREQLLGWAGHFAAPTEVVLTHGERAAAEALARDLRSRSHLAVTIPARGDVIDLQKGAACR